MKKIAIVGTSQLRTNQEGEVNDLVMDIFNTIHEKNFGTQNLKDGFMLISGGARGVDTIAMKVAKECGIETMIFNPKKQTWYYFRKRNLKMAEECDELYCISVPTITEPCYHHVIPQDHQKTAGCWTLNEASKLGKKCRLYIL